MWTPNKPFKELTPLNPMNGFAERHVTLKNADVADVALNG